MRVLLLNDSAHPVGGAELQTLRTREQLVRAGHRVRVLASTGGQDPRSSAADALCFGTTHPKLRVVNQTANPSAVRALRRELAGFRPDVVHIRMYLTQLSPLVLPLLRDVPTLWQAVYYKAICPRGTKVLPDGSPCRVRSGTVCMRTGCVTPQSWGLDMLQQRMWRRWSGSLDAVITLSETMRTTLEGEGIPITAVIPNGVQERPARPPLEGRPTVAFAGRLVPEKGVGILLDAFARVVRDVPDARLVIAGTGPEEASLRARVASLGLTEHAELLGHRSRDELERRFDAAWVQAIPGIWAEPGGNVTLEAMMRGTAVVASAIGGPAEAVRDGQTGVLVEPGSVDALADALRTLVTDMERCERLGAAGRAVALAEYSEEIAVRRLEAVYRRMLSSDAGSTDDADERRSA